MCKVLSQRVKKPGIIICLFNGQLPEEISLPLIVKAHMALLDGVTVALAVVALSLFVASLSCDEADVSLVSCEVSGGNL